jgi:hypothetical protein
MRLTLRYALAALTTALTVGTMGLGGGCQLLVGLDPVTLEPDGGTGSSSSASSSSASSSSASSSSASSSSSGCTPTTCAALGIACGMQPDGCGNMLDCNDGVKDQNETDVDCGGPGDPNKNRPACPPCARGLACMVNNDCQSELCADGVCCNTACTAVCQQCNNPGAPGVCGFTPQFMDNKTCNSSQTCDGQGNCKDQNGVYCTANTDCASGNCGWNGVSNVCQ